MVGRYKQTPYESGQRDTEDSDISSQAAFLHRAKMNSLARFGDWSQDLET